MKIMILTATIGQGHNAVASSLQKEFERRKVPCKTVDLYGTVSPALKEVVSKGYLVSIRSVTYTRNVGVHYYNAMEKTYRPAKSTGPLSLPGRYIAQRLRSVIEEYRPSLIICTQVYCAHTLHLMKELGWLKIPTIAVITDFTVQAHWAGTGNIDYISIPTSELRYQLQKKGIREDRIIESGIPINPDFSVRVPKEEARSMLELDPDKKTLLVMGGSMGYGNMVKTVKDLDGIPLDYQMMIVCGNNRSLQRKLQKVSFTKNVRLYGYCRKIPLLMDAADAVITKPGGLSLSEALAKKLPMILMNAIPGMEDHNAEFMLNHGLALKPSKNFPVTEAVYTLLTSPTAAGQMRDAMEIYAKPRSTETLCDFALDLLK